MAPKPTAEPTDAPSPSGTSRFFSEEEVAQLVAQAEETARLKLTPELDKARQRADAFGEDLKELQKFRKNFEKAEADKQKAIDEAARIKAESELSAKELAEKYRTESEARIAQLAAQQDAERAHLAKELDFMKLQNYAQRRVTEESENIAPELIDFIGGNTPEEIEASIEVVKSKTAQIVENMRQAGIRQRQGMPGVAPAAGTNGITQLDQPTDRQYSADDIKNMDFGAYAEFRKRVGMPGISGRGLFD
jgi:hypothetical protein